MTKEKQKMIKIDPKRGIDLNYSKDYSYQKIPLEKAEFRDFLSLYRFEWDKGHAYVKDSRDRTFKMTRKDWNSLNREYLVFETTPVLDWTFKTPGGHLFIQVKRNSKPDYSQLLPILAEKLSKDEIGNLIVLLDKRIES